MIGRGVCQLLGDGELYIEECFVFFFPNNQGDGEERLGTVGDAVSQSKYCCSGHLGFCLLYILNFVILLLLFTSQRDFTYSQHDFTSNQRHFVYRNKII